MLKLRVVTALVMVTVGLAAVFWMPATGFAVLVGLALPVVGGWEAARLAGIDQPLARWLYGIGLGALAVLIHYLAMDPAWLLSLAGLLWLINLAWLSRPDLGRSGQPPVIAIKLIVLGGVLLAAWLGLSLLQSLSPWLVFLLLVIIAAADTAAYFSGRHFGGAKLAPTISPGKTRAGALGGLLGAAVLTPIAGELIPLSPFAPFMLAALAFGIAMISIGGDLFISLLKRQRQLKDTSNLLPGHGGILDRFDSMAAAVPFFSLAVLHAGGTPLAG
ncbi:phosphatidate cytidylyltransferase [Wenzhouxiangella sp. EGI_FJ10409]|uniref:phosphatidate cytidylyltransferase n=1 Tax=Wenzhouxiangella sp. EGI_FJ10409 TaxID=3243767 RepID=UPI0035DB748A